MFRHVSQLVVRIADLAEAEGRELRKVVHRVGLSFAVMIVAAGLLLVGSALLVAALWQALDAPLGRAGASAVTGVVALAMAAGALVAAHRINK